MIRRVARRLGLLITAVLILCLGAGVAWGMYYGTNRLPIKRYFSTDYTNAVWDWSNILDKQPAELRGIGSFMHLHQLNTVYIDVGRYADILNDKDKAQAAVDRQDLAMAIERYVTALQTRGIKVYAAAGDTNWSDRDKHYLPLGILAFVQEYNAAYPEAKLAGVEFDVEAYNQPGFADGSLTVKSLVLTDYLSMVQELVQAQQTYTHKTTKQLEIGFAIPYWLDNENGNIPSVNWHEKTGPTLFHLLDQLNALPKSNVVVMAYRNAARGNDGVIAHSRTEVDYAHAKAPHVRVIIGQEVTDVEPAKITYFGSSKTDLSAQFGYVRDEFKTSGTFGGIAINDLTGYESMLEGD
ncbi:MAG TPA: hypothetical protein VLF40_05735 [Candidatus Saccharimonadales bacterium]|nr:hypothetical protein [Candidatus Saccharimonadales bacterium]